MDRETEPPLGATTDLPHDRITVQRFRDSFPRARWSDRLNAWFVPGRTASSASTPYSRTVVTEIREIPLARWDGDHGLWTVPYRSLVELRRQWPAIEAAAERNEPDVRKARREALKGTGEEEAGKARTSERRRKRYPLPVNDMPPFERAIGTRAGVIIFTDTQGELADSEVVTTFYFEPPLAEEYIWAAWRPGSLEELVTTWPARTPPGEREVARGWWVPDLDELRVARQRADRNGAPSSGGRN